LIDKRDHHSLPTKKGEPGPGSPFLLILLQGDDVYYSPACFRTKFNCSGCKCEQSVVLTAANIYSRVEVSAALADNNFAGIYCLAIVTLHA
jgi:hypothetical protein